MRAAAMSLLLSLAALAPARSLSLEPMTATLEPSGPGSVGTFRLRNEGEARIAVQLRLLARSFDGTGAETGSPAGQSFALYPSRLVLEPGASAAVKIKWNGDAAPARELPFRLVAEQVPVEEGGAARPGLRILFRYIASVYVSPRGAAPSLEVAYAVGALGPRGEAGVLVSLANRGSRHVVACDPVISLAPPQGAAPVAALGPADLKAVDGLNFLPGFARCVFVPNRDAVPGVSYAARIEYRAED